MFLIQGFIAQETLKFNDKTLDLTQISRRRHQRGGARFFSRGIDEAGNCGITVETEMIVTHEKTLYSFV